MNAHIDSLDHGTRNKIIESARKLFAEHGLDGTSTRDIARASGLNVSLISYYFGGKEKLYEAIILEFAVFVRNEINQIYHQYSTETLTSEIFKEETRLVVSKILDLHLGNPEMGIILEREKLTNFQHSRDVHETIFVPIGETFCGLVERGKELGFIKKEINSKAFFVMLVQGISGFVMATSCTTSFISHDTYKFPEQKDEFVNFIVTIFTEGILK